MTKRHARPPAPQIAEPQRSTSAFRIFFTEDAARDAKSLDGSIRLQLRKVLEKKIALDPVAYGLPLRGPLANFWKHQFATHRIIYRIYSERRLVVICAVGPRKEGDAEDIYRQLDAVAKTGRIAEQLAGILRKLSTET